MPCNFVLGAIKSGLLGHLNIHGSLIISESGRVVLGTTRPSHPVAVFLCTLTASKSGLCCHLDIQSSLVVASVAWKCTELLAQTRLDGLLHGTSSKAPSCPLLVVPQYPTHAQGCHCNRWHAASARTKPMQLLLLFLCSNHNNNASANIASAVM